VNSCVKCLGSEICMFLFFSKIIFTSTITRCNLFLVGVYTHSFCNVFILPTKFFYQSNQKQLYSVTEEFQTMILIFSGTCFQNFLWRFLRSKGAQIHHLNYDDCNMACSEPEPWLFLGIMIWSRCFALLLSFRECTYLSHD
jgi:hypothetical protein